MGVGLIRNVIAALLLMLPSIGMSQSVGPCTELTRVDLIAEPWDANTRSFGDGAVRIAVVDTIAPAIGAFHLILFSPPLDENDKRQCRVISGTEEYGFGGLSLEGISVDFEPGQKLELKIAAAVFEPDGETFVGKTLLIDVDQSSGEISAKLR